MSITSHNIAPTTGLHQSNDGGFPNLTEKMAAIGAELDDLSRGNIQGSTLKRLALVDRAFAIDHPVVADLIDQTQAEIEAALKHRYPGVLQYARDYYAAIEPLGEFLLNYYERNCLMSRRYTIVFVDKNESSLLGLLKPDVEIQIAPFSLDQFIGDLVDFFLSNEIANLDERKRNALLVGCRQHDYADVEEIKLHRTILADVWRDTPHISRAEPFTKNSFGQARAAYKRRMTREMNNR